MIRWNNDYCYGAHPAVLKMLTEINDTAYPGYGKDVLCEEASDMIRKKFSCKDADIHFFSGGTQTNFVMIKAALTPYQHVVCHVLSHINRHEGGAIENAGIRIQTHDGKDGKITPDVIREEGKFYKETEIPEFYTEPKMVYLSFPTEVGTLYTKKELEDIRKVCDEYDMYLYIDGARLGYGLGSPKNDVTCEDIARLADCFYIGGTKCGCLYGEAMVLINDKLKIHYRNYMKQNGAIMSKGYLLGAQFKALFKDDLYFNICKKATLQAFKIKAAFAEKGIPFYSESFTNQQFLIFENSQLKKINEKHITDHEKTIDESHTAARFCTMWATKDEDVETLVNDIKKL